MASNYFITSIYIPNSEVISSFTSIQSPGFIPQYIESAIVPSTVDSFTLYNSQNIGINLRSTGGGLLFFLNPGTSSLRVYLESTSLIKTVAGGIGSVLNPITNLPNNTIPSVSALNIINANGYIDDLSTNNDVLFNHPNLIIIDPFNPENVIISDYNNHNFRLLNRTSGLVTSTTPVGFGALAVSPDYNEQNWYFVGSGSSSNGLSRMNIITGQRIGSNPFSSYDTYVLAIACKRDGSKIYVGAYLTTQHSEIWFYMTNSTRTRSLSLSLSLYIYIYIIS